MSSDEDEAEFHHPACACCRIQKKRCDQFCAVAEFFPHTKLKEFQNAHRLFGAGNILKMMDAVKVSDMQDAADSILAEGLARRIDPVRGCYGIIRTLKAEVAAAEQELAAIKRLLALCKARANSQAAANAEMDRRMIILHRGGLNNPPPVRESLAMPVARALVEGGDQAQQNRHTVHQMPDGLNFPRAMNLVINKNSEAQDIYVYLSTLDESAGYLSPFDLHKLDQMVKSFPQGNIPYLGSSHVVGDRASASSMGNGKQIVAGAKVGGHYHGLSSKGEEVFDDKD